MLCKPEIRSRRFSGSVLNLRLALLRQGRVRGCAWQIRHTLLLFQMHSFQPKSPKSAATDSIAQHRHSAPQKRESPRSALFCRHRNRAHPRNSCRVRRGRSDTLPLHLVPCQTSITRFASFSISRLRTLFLFPHQRSTESSNDRAPTALCRSSYLSPRLLSPSRAAASFPSYFALPFRNRLAVLANSALNALALLTDIRQDGSNTSFDGSRSTAAA